MEDKIEFIDYLVKNGYQYCENQLFVRIEKLTDDLGNVEDVFEFDKTDGTLSICADRQINDKDDKRIQNDCYTLSSIEVEILSILISLFL